MIIDRLYKVSAFGNYIDIIPTPENMSFFLERFGKFGMVPSVFQEINVDNVQSTPRQLQRLSLISSDSLEQFMVGSSRIDFQIRIQDDKALSSEDLDKYNNKISVFFSEVFTKFGVLSNRLAMNTESLLLFNSPTDFENVVKGFRNPIALFNESQLAEWSYRLMIKKAFPIQGTLENTNVIGIISSAKLRSQISTQSIVTESDGLVVTTDINTIAENIDMRFNGDCVLEFIKKACIYRTQILENTYGASAIV